MVKKKPNISLRALIAGFTAMLATLTIPSYSEAETLSNISEISYQEDFLKKYEKEKEINKLDKINAIPESDLSFLYKVKIIFDS